MKYFKLSTLLFIVLAAACNVKNTMPGPEAKIDESALKKIAATAYNNEAWKDVIRYYKQLTKKIPNNAELWYRIGNAYTQLNQTRFAVDAYQKALAIDSSNSKILHNMGVVQLQESTRTFNIELKLKNDKGALRAGVSTQLIISAEEVTAHLVSPALLSLNDEGIIGIKIIEEKNKVKFIPADIVLASDEGVYIAGLPFTSTIITVGQGYVKSGMRVNLISESDTRASVAAQTKKQGQ